MKVLKIVGLGLAIWGLSLLWPEVNLALTPPVMAGWIIGLVVTVMMIHVLRQLWEMSKCYVFGSNSKAVQPL